MPHIMYLVAECPWSGCDCCYWGVDFRLERISPTLYVQGMKAWQRDLCLVARCPRCGQFIAFSVDAITKADVAPPGSVTLPDDWYTYAEFMDKQGQVVKIAP